MFNYFGGKRSLAPTYQVPRYDVIVEPFAGSAQYAVYWLKQRSDLSAVLFDIDPRVVSAWRRLLAATPEEIVEWEPIPPGADQIDYLDQANAAAGWRPRSAGRAYQEFLKVRSRLALDRAIIGDRVEIYEVPWYRADAYLDDLEVCWFIDPPYQYQGHQYSFGSDGIDYQILGDWCRSRPGQTIVTEAAPADWLPFTPHRTLRDQTGGTNVELVWYSDPEPDLFSLLEG